MLKIMRGFVVLALGVSLQGQEALAGEETHAGQAVRDSAKASGFASQGSAHGIIASGQATSAVTAVPLASGGAVLGAAGAASAQMAHDSAAAASAPAQGPLPVVEETITILPPDEALKNRDKGNPAR
ncbi:MAG: hypothetical protein HQL97_16165 [Magnetococcales bacterium]|nr:hypothetical protein [Magnetococcales bacterium]